MDNTFILIGYDGVNLNGPLAKRKFPSYDEAADHARAVLNSNGNPNLSCIYIMQAVAIAQRTSPPVEIVPILRKAA